MQDPYLDSVLEVLANEAGSSEGPHLISVDELRAAGARRPRRLARVARPRVPLHASRFRRRR